MPRTGEAREGAPAPDCLHLRGGLPPGILPGADGATPAWEAPANPPSTPGATRVEVPRPPPGLPAREDLPKYPIGSLLDSKEHGVALAGIPKTDRGKRLCLAFNCHSGCHRGGNCRDAHQPLDSLRASPGRRGCSSST